MGKPLTFLLSCFTVSLIFSATNVQSKIYFHEKFGPGWADRWVKSTWKDSESLSGVFKESVPRYTVDEEKDKGIMTSEDHKFYAMTAALDESFSNKGKPLVLQYQVELTKPLSCGGAYLKFGPKMDDPTKFKDDTKYNVMFGPDVCGSTRKTHVILNYKNKNRDKKKDVEIKVDENISHLYTFILKPDNTYEVLIDQEEVASGSILKDWSLLKPKMINDPAVSKPKDWVDEEMMDDPNDKKPDDWVDEATIPDPNAKKPDDWDEEDDGEWKPYKIANPDFKGEWKAKRIPNPDFKGKWEHPQIANPEYVEDQEAYAYESFGQVSFDLWQVSSGVAFDNIVITDSVEEAKAIANELWKPLKTLQQSSVEEEAKKEEERRERESKEAAESAAEEPVEVDEPAHEEDEL